MADRDDLVALACRIAGWARDGEQVEAYVARGRDTDVRVYEGEIESLSTADSEGVGVRVVAGGREGFAYAGSLDEESLAEVLADARDNAAFASPDEFVGLAEPDGVAPPDIDPYAPELEAFPTSAKVDLALDLERRVRAGDGRIRAVEQTAYADGRGESAVATSTGIVASSRRTACVVWSYAIAGEGAGTQTGGGSSAGRHPGDLDLDRAAREAVERSTRLLGATKPTSARVTAVLDPSVASSFLAVLTGPLSGEAVLKGRSLFAGRVGEQVAAPLLTLWDDPSDPAAYSAGRFDAEGLASRPVPLITDGVLQGFLYDTYAARRTGTSSTASAVRGGFKSGPGVGARAARPRTGDQTAAEILAEVGDGLLVQNVKGLHSGVNTVSGDFSVGAEGLMIRGGELAEPVREITVASTIQRMLRDLVAVGNDLEWRFGSTPRVTLAIADVSMAGA